MRPSKNFKNLKHRSSFKTPFRNVLMEGADAVLLKNFIVEAGLFNGAQGEVVRCVYKPGESPLTGHQPAYVLFKVDGLVWPDCCQPWDPDNPVRPRLFPPSSLLA